MLFILITFWYTKQFRRVHRTDIQTRRTFSSTTTIKHMFRDGKRNNSSQRKNCVLKWLLKERNMSERGLLLFTSMAECVPSHLYNWCQYLLWFHTYSFSYYCVCGFFFLSSFHQPICLLSSNIITKLAVHKKRSKKKPACTYHESKKVILYENQKLKIVTY